jgi:hypothetical protein
VIDYPYHRPFIGHLILVLCGFVIEKAADVHGAVFFFTCSPVYAKKQVPYLFLGTEEGLQEEVIER